MNLQKLATMSNLEIAKWVRGNTDKFTLLPECELLETLDQRDHWESKATELATDVGKLLDTEVGEHSNMNNPVQNAIDAVFHANNKKEKAIALKQRLKGVIDGKKVN